MNGTTQTDRPTLVKIVGTVADIMLAPAHNKPGKIELENGRILHAFSDKLQMVERGRSYDFGCEPTEFRGVLNHTVRAVRAAGGSDKLGPAPANFVTTEEVLAQRRQQPQRAIDAQAVLLNSGRQEPRQDFTEIANGPAPAQAKPQAPQYYQQRPTAPKDGKRMCVTSLMNAGIISHQIQFTRESLAAAFRAVSDAYDDEIGQDDA